MAGGLDELIEYLLEEIALGGQTGITFLGLAALVEQFYHPSLEHQEEPESNGQKITSHGISTILEIDRQFLSRVWTWLSRHPDISIGSNRQFNDKSLDEIEKIYPGYTYTIRNTDSPATAPTAFANAEHQHDNTGQSAFVPPAGQEQAGPHLFVSDERMSLAITGHLPDPARVVPSEWALLSCIAASRRNGIMQGDLIRASKQDKRSVPKRTDALHQKGYIFKKSLYVKGNKTSRLYLRRFVDAEQSTGSSATPITEQLTIAHVARQLFEVLKNNPLIPQEDLSEVLGMKSFGRARIMLQLIRHFTKLGCLKRIKTAFAPTAQSKDLKVCIQFLKEPSVEDGQTQSTQDIDLNQSIEILASLYDADAEQSYAVNAEVDGNLDTDVQNDLLATDVDTADDTRSLLPQWNPDRVLANVVVDILRARGSEGATNANVKNKITGPFVRRIIESLLVKLSNRTLQSQPPNIRHLSVIRITELHQGVLRYLHFSFDIFLEKVKKGLAKWEDAAGGSFFHKEVGRSGKDMLTVLEHVESDEFGFALRSRLPAHPHDGEATVGQLIRDAKIKPIKPRPGEPELKRFDDGHLELLPYGELTKDLENQILSLTHPPYDHASIAQLAAPTESSKQSATALHLGSESQKLTKPKKLVQKPKHLDRDGQPIKGRPRKFMRGTEKYWRDVCTFIIQDRNPDSRKKLNKAGITTDPETQQIFRGRPTGFDEVILQAIEQELPVAAAACDINEKWMSSMMTVMSRSQPGLYITPLGYQYESGRRKAQIFILKSKRLMEVDWSDRKQWWPWQQYASSASHSFRYQRYYPYTDLTCEQAADSMQMRDSDGKIVMSDTPALVNPLRNVSLKDAQASSENTSIPATTSRRIMVQIPARTNHEDVQPLSDTVRASTNPARRIIIQIPARQLEPGDSRQVTERDGGLLYDVQRVIEGQSGNAVVAPLQSDQRHPKPSQTPKGVKEKTVPFKPQNAVTRSSRKRRPTQKAAENLESIQTESGNPRRVVDEAHDDIKTQHADLLPQSRVDMTPDSPPLEVTTSEMPESTTAHHHENGSDKLVVSEAVQSNEVIDTLKTGLESNKPLICTEDQKLEPPEKNVIPEAQSATSKNVADEHQINESADTVAASFGYAAVPPTGTMTLDMGQLTESVHLVRPEQLRPDMLESSMELSLVVTPDPTIGQPATIPMLNPRKRARDKSAESEYRPDIEQQQQTTPVPTTPATKRARTDGSYEAKRAEVSKLVRALVLELVGLCSGLMPNVPWTLRRAMVPRWQEAGVTSEQLTVKNIRAAIKAHCESGKLKQITFAFRSKTGAMTRMSVLGLRGIDSTSPAVLELQKKMAEMEPADYFPPELEAESMRTPNELNKKRYIKELNERKAQETAFELSHTPGVVRSRGSTIRTSSTAIGPEYVIGQQTQSSGPTLVAERLLTTEPDLASESEPVTSLNTGFLTLKISRLRELDLPTGTLPRYTVPTLFPIAQLGEAGTKSDFQATKPKWKPRGPNRRRAQTNGSAHFDSDAHKLIWKQKWALPTSLEQIPKINLTRDKALPAVNAVPGSTVFEAEVDCVAAWELNFLDGLPDARAEGLIFINHLMSHEDLTPIAKPETVEFEALIRFNTSLNKLVEASFPGTESWPRFVSALQAVEDAPTLTTRVTGSRMRRATKRKADTELDLEDEDHARPAPKRRKPSRVTRRARRTLHTAASYNDATISVWAPLKRNRTGQILRHMTEEEKYEVVVAVVLVRTILGGIEKFIDWRIVLRIMSNREESLIRDAWKTMANRYRNDVSELTDSLQYRYLEALSNDSVPSVNFDDVHATDWEGIYQWALTNLDKTLAKRIEELPATRVQLLRRNDYVFSEPRCVRDLLGYNVIHTVPRREEVLSGTIFGKPLHIESPHIIFLRTKSPAEDEQSDIDLCRAKSWVMATLLTPEEFFDIKTIHVKLLTLADTPNKVEDLLERAIKSLQRDKLVSRASHVIAGSGEREDTPFVRLRRYEISAKFFEQFEYRRLITTPMLKRAARYKFDVLDAAFRLDDTVVIVKDTILNDGEMVAILNLVSMGMLKIKPGPDVPNSLWGLGWQSHQYTTRMIDKKALGFSIILSPIRHAYIYGDPVATKRAHSNAIVPRGEIDMLSGQGRIPIWFDITHRFQPGLWEMVLGVVLGLVSVRPGVEARELVKMMWYSVAVEEVNLILEWAARLDLVKRTNSGFGWETCAWWWLGVGSGGGWRTDEHTVTDVGVDHRVGSVPVVAARPGQAIRDTDVVGLASGSGQA